MSALLARERRSWVYSLDDATMPCAPITNEKLSPELEPVARGREGLAPHIGSAVDDPRYAAVRADVEARLRAVCASLPPELFDELVRDICARKVRWAREEDAQRRNQ